MVSLPTHICVTRHQWVNLRLIQLRCTPLTGLHRQELLKPGLWLVDTAPVYGLIRRRMHTLITGMLVEVYRGFVIFSIVIVIWYNWRIASCIYIYIYIYISDIAVNSSTRRRVFKIESNTWVWNNSDVTACACADTATCFNTCQLKRNSIFNIISIITFKYLCTEYISDMSCTKDYTPKKLSRFLIYNASGITDVTFQ